MLNEWNSWTQQEHLTMSLQCGFSLDSLSFTYYKIRVTILEFFHTVLSLVQIVKWSTPKCLVLPIFFAILWSLRAYVNCFILNISFIKFGFSSCNELKTSVAMVHLISILVQLLFSNNSWYVLWIIQENYKSSLLY